MRLRAYVAEHSVKHLRTLFEGVVALATHKTEAGEAFTEIDVKIDDGWSLVAMPRQEGATSARTPALVKMDGSVEVRLVLEPGQFILSVDAIIVNMGKEIGS